jgi:hypothetical protein
MNIGRAALLAVIHGSRVHVLAASILLGFRQQELSILLKATITKRNKEIGLANLIVSRLVPIV